MVEWHSRSFASGGEADLELLDEIQRRVLWLAVRMVDSANHDRDASDGVKVGGHQASSASLVTAMTALWFAHLEAQDRVAVKPHASPVLHAMNYLLGDLDRSYLTRLRARGGLQPYPSRTKDARCSPSSVRRTRPGSACHRCRRGRPRGRGRRWGSAGGRAA
jgi:pyruvate dehydrogenase complex dehydrogenase (E1) component